MHSTIARDREQESGAGSTRVLRTAVLGRGLQPGSRGILTHPGLHAVLKEGVEARYSVRHGFTQPRAPCTGLLGADPTSNLLVTAVAAIGAARLSICTVNLFQFSQ